MSRRVTGAYLLFLDRLCCSGGSLPKNAGRKRLAASELARGARIVDRGGELLIAGARTRNARVFPIRTGLLYNAFPSN
jgi:hypothetical protein